MMDRPLLVSSLVEHAGQVFHDAEIVTRTVEGPIQRYTYRDLRDRSRRLARALANLGVREGDRVGTIAWNTYRHVEAYFAISGMGAICHTLNPRLHPDQFTYIVNHAGDRILLADTTFLPLIEATRDRLTSVEHLVVLAGSTGRPEPMPEGALLYDDLIEAADDGFAWPELDERTASSLCYTSGTTGNPKGVLYSHRSTVLHSYALALPDAMSLSEDDAVLPVVPMFHVNAWGLPYGAALTGVKLVLPGPALDGRSLTELMNAEGVTIAAGVPTVWHGLLHHWDEAGTSVPTLRRTIVGGAAPPLSMIETFEGRYGVDFRHAWGMTETSPLGTVSRPKPALRNAPPADRYAIRTRQGRPVFGVDLKIVATDGTPLPHDGSTSGELFIRGPWVASGYFGDERDGSYDSEGWFGTGDVATIDPDGYVQITDRLKDVIKSGGEWISSIELENAAMGHPDVAQAAVIGIPHAKWDERPLLIVLPRPGATPDAESIRAYLQGKVARWWIPEEVRFVESLPMGATGKVLKTELRARFASVPAPPPA